MKNQKGVTLIALVVTIIVLIILAGVAIAALTGDNGLITRSRESKKLQIEGEVRDQVTLAIAAAKVVAENKATVNAGFSAAANLAATGDTAVIMKEIRADLGTPAEGETYSTKGFKCTPSYTDGDTGTILIEYTTAAYQQACNNPDAKISVTITVTRNNFTIPVSSSWTYGTSIA